MSTVPSWLEDPSAPSESDGRLTDARPSDSPLAGPRPSLAAGAPHPLRVGVVSIFVFCLLASGAIGSFVIFKQKVSTDERRLLDERAAQNASLFEAFTVQIEDALDRGTIVTAASEVDQAAFEQAFNESLDESLLTTAAVFEIDELGQRTEVLSTGAEASVLKVITEAGRERMHRASAQGGVQLVDIATVGGAKIVGLAAAPAGGSSRIAYAELLVPEVIGDAGSTQGEDIEFAFYLADRETSDALVASNARVLPIAPPRVVNRMQLGSEEPLFIVGARDSLVGPVTALSPWIALTIGFIAAVILSSFVETTRRGRDEALHLVDDLRITNADLDRSEKRFRGLFDSANDVVFTAKADGTILSMNQAGELFTGYGHNELLGKDFAELLASSDAKPTQDEFSELISSLADGGAREIELVTRDGERAALELSVQLVETRGRTEAVQGIGRDIRERQRLQQQLFQSQKMEAVGQLAGGVAHDFNNVLTAIATSSEFLLMDLPADEPLREEAQEIKKATGRATRLTQQLLAFSRRQVLQAEALDVNEIVVEVEHMLSRLIGKSFQLELALTDDLGAIEADPGQLEQVIVNLVVNASHAMPDGGTITIETQNIDSFDPASVNGEQGRVGPHILLAVRDTGHGMDEETRERIFEPFFTTKEKGKGTGLGLATVHGIVTQSGGHLSVESELGTGTTFSIHFPRAAAGAS